MTEDRIIGAGATREDEAAEASIRPRSLGDYLGQQPVREQMEIYIQAAKGRGEPGLVPPPIDDIEAFWSPAEKAMVKDALACSVVGDATDLREGIAAFADRHRPDELMLTGNIFDHAARKHSFALAAGAFIDTRLA